MDHYVSFMERAIACGRQSVPFAGVNPAVGAILVRDGVVLGSGFHRGPGSPHAEVAAIHDAVARSGNPDIARGADLFCTLEPCCHRGGGKLTPPCTDAIIQAGIARVFCACLDPNPKVDGGGVSVLRQNGIIVETGLLEAEADFLIEAFRVSIREKRPFVRLKWAQSLDGQIACVSGASRWITPAAARTEAHTLRASHNAVLVGSGTLTLDDPELTVRMVTGKDPLRVVLAGRGSLPKNRKLFSPRLREGTLVLAASGSLALSQCSAWGISVLEIPPDAAGLPDLAQALMALYRQGIGSLLVEGGSGILGAFVQAGLWDAVTIFMAPLLLGRGISAISHIGTVTPAQAPRLAEVNIQTQAGYHKIEGRKESLVSAENRNSRELPCLPV